MGCGASYPKYPSFDINAPISGGQLPSISETVTVNGVQVLNALSNYKGCEAAIRKAITNPTPEAENEALIQLLPAVDILHEFFEFSKKLEDYLPVLFEPLCTDDPVSSIQTNMGCARVLGEVFNFALRFDDLKMVNPAIQNDFSYYRRTLNRLKLSKQDKSIEIRVTGEVANRMSLFFAYPTPMMRVLIDATTKYINTTSQGTKLADGLAHLANFFTTYLNEAGKSGAPANDTTLKVVAYLTGTIVLYDQISTEGAFKKNSPIMIRDALKGVKAYSQNQALFANAIRFTTAHFNDASTPESIKNL